MKLKKGEQNIKARLKATLRTVSSESETVMFCCTQSLKLGDEWRKGNYPRTDSKPSMPRRKQTLSGDQSSCPTCSYVYRACSAL